MNPYFQNQSCDPFTPQMTPCELGNYASYSINITSPKHVVAAIEFCREHNVRLVIKNTGHDFLGKSTGKGALSLWTRNLKTSKFIKRYKSDKYKGPAMKLGAGVTAYEALEAAYSTGHRTVGGDCPTVGISGGYTQGGGHSPLTSAYGMAADQALEWELITAAGQHLIATPTKNADLYWALSGGGPGTFAIVLAVTVKVYPEGPMGTAMLSFNGSTVDHETYLSAMDGWWMALPDIVDSGATVIWSVSSDGFAFRMLNAPDKTANQVAAMMDPFLRRLANLGVNYVFVPGQTSSYYEHYNQTMGPLPYGSWPASMLFNSRMVPRAVAESDQGRSKLTAAMHAIVMNKTVAPWSFGCSAFNVRNISHPANAVASYWRDAIALCNSISLWDWTIPRSEMLARKVYLAEAIAAKVEAVTPGSGAYLNEVDSFMYPPNSLRWQEDLYGSNYAKLRSIKDKWDPDSIFYAHTAVGSEDWLVDDIGRLCRN
ncbi:hypothetical protein CDD81_708 [Ophiocordyceps australis]|uniref:FAD-binding PCMH-type domain-containing protein n=1 Tax=Ophiocordyceps australis TaxID=1399860 RepID=A0A2C5XV87_9HYPO|nr:hypothetical protein CDD81_708 [Ophiocordyceps australis]